MSSLYRLETYRSKKVVPDKICLETSQFTKLFYCERISHIPNRGTIYYLVTKHYTDSGPLLITDYTPATGDI